MKTTAVRSEHAPDDETSAVLTRLNQSDRPRVAVNLRPRDAASLVLIDRSADAPRLLVGRRHPGQVFLPNKVVFPGGRVERCDSQVQFGDVLHPLEAEKLLLDIKGAPSVRRARALALAAVRELFEETGLIFGKRAPNIRTRSPLWQPFVARGYTPTISRLMYFARAITPPRRPRRYDTRFFIATSDGLAGERGDLDGELGALNWLTFEEARQCNLHVMTRTILDEAEMLLDARWRPKRRRSLPYYYERAGVFRQETLQVPG
ncbi:MAG: NUDIX domain-containing protein [Pseudomonadota bacterium]